MVKSKMSSMFSINVTYHLLHRQFTFLQNSVSSLLLQEAFPVKPKCMSCTFFFIPRESSARHYQNTNLWHWFLFIALLLFLTPKFLEVMHCVYSKLTIIPTSIPHIFLVPKFLLNEWLNSTKIPFSIRKWVFTQDWWQWWWREMDEFRICFEIKLTGLIVGLDVESEGDE